MDSQELYLGSLRAIGLDPMAHDIRFDMPFLRWELMRRDHDFPCQTGICTLQLSRALWPDAPSHSLGELAVTLDLAHVQPHRAGDDALAAAGITAADAHAEYLTPFQISVTIQNLTYDQIISPPVVVVHDGEFSLFQPGQQAAGELAALAEDEHTRVITAYMEGVSDGRAFMAAGDPPPWSR